MYGHGILYILNEVKSMNKRTLKRIPLHKLMDLKVDYAFKQLFGSERNKKITIVFLNAILHRTGRDTIQEVIFVNREMGGEFLDDKQSRLDIVVQTGSGELINVEMQLSNQNDMMKRTLFYWSRLFTDQLQKGKGYHTLLPTITINICDFTLFTERDAYHSTYHIYEDTTMTRLSKDSDVFEIHFIEMKKFIQAWYGDELNPLEDILVRWLLLLGMVDARKQRVYDEIYKELEALAMKDENLLEAFTAWENLSQTPDTIMAYHSRLKAIIDEEAKLDYMHHKGREEGIEEGREEGKIEIAKSMLLDQESIEKIIRYTGLSEEFLKELKEKL